MTCVECGAALVDAPPEQRPVEARPLEASTGEAVTAAPEPGWIPVAPKPPGAGVGRLAGALAGVITLGAMAFLVRDELARAVFVFAGVLFGYFAVMATRALRQDAWVVPRADAVEYVAHGLRWVVPYADLASASVRCEEVRARLRGVPLDLGYRVSLVLVRKDGSSEEVTSHLPPGREGASPRAPFLAWATEVARTVGTPP